MIASGLLDRSIKETQNPKGIRSKIEDIGPQKLTMDHLELSFVLWLFPLVCSGLAFLIEVVTSAIKRIKNRSSLKAKLVTSKTKSRQN